MPGLVEALAERGNAGGYFPLFVRFVGFAITFETATLV